MKIRISRHNNGLEKSTAPGRPWLLLWSIEKSSRSEAKSLEKKLKNLSRQRTIEFMLKYNEGLAKPDYLEFLYELNKLHIVKALTIALGAMSGY